MRLPSGTNSSEWGLDPPPPPPDKLVPASEACQKSGRDSFWLARSCAPRRFHGDLGPGVRDVPVGQSNRWGQALLTCDRPGLKKPGFLIDEFCAGDSWADGADGIRLKMGGGTWRRNPPWMSNGARRQQDALVLGFSSTNGTSAPSGYREPV